MKVKSLILIICALIHCESMASSDVNEVDRVEALKKKCVTGCTAEEIDEINEKSNGLDSLVEGFKFGVAIGFEHYGSPYITEVETIGEDRTVIITDSQESKPSIWLETHYLWDGKAKELGLTHSAPGFYVGARLLGADSDVFDAFSLGLLWSFKRTKLGAIPPKGQIAESINIGLGPVWHKTRTLADGIIEGQPLPADYNDIKFKAGDELSWMLMISAGF